MNFFHFKVERKYVIFLTMKTIDLTLRQRKILYMIQSSTDFVTSKSLADELHVSSRTIRNDIVEMNKILEPYNTRIISQNSKGFLFESDNPEKINQLTKVDIAVFTRTERIRYLAFRLCEATEPLNLLDLEDEIFVSHSVLISDIAALKQKYTYGEANIRVITKGDLVSIEQDEPKIRALILSLFHEDWDYNTSKNAYYGHYFLDGRLMRIVLSNVPKILSNYQIRLDDSTLVAFELSLVIMHHRYKTGHCFPESSHHMTLNSTAGHATTDIFQLIEDYAKVKYPASEKDRIWNFLSNVSLSPQEWNEPLNPDIRISPFARNEAIKYLRHINEIFKVDFSKDAEFVAILQIFLQQLLAGNTAFNQKHNYHSTKEHLTAEYELAWQFQTFAQEYLHRFLYETEIDSLAILFTGAIRHYFDLNPQNKLQVVLFSHRNMALAWALKRKILEGFHLYLDVKAIYPINYMKSYDYSDVDIALITVDKKIPAGNKVETILIDDSEDMPPLKNPEVLKLLSFKKLWPQPDISMDKLFKESFWVDCFEVTEFIQIIKAISNEYIIKQIATDQHFLDIIHRESHVSFAMKNGIMFLYTLIPAEKTQLSVMHLTQRFRYNDFRINTIVVATFEKEERNLIFPLKILLCNNDYDYDVLGDITSPDDFWEYINQNKPFLF